MRGVPLLVGLVACTKSEPIAWVEGFGYGWTGFNHRIAHLEYAIEGDEAVVAVVGGTSTTGQDVDLDESCDPDTCMELPLTDTSDVDLRWVRAQPGKLRAGRAWAEVVTDADGAETNVSVPLDRKASGDAVAFIGGLSLDTDHEPVSGPSCYDPAFGWLPRGIHVGVRYAALADDGRSVDVDLVTAFGAGLSLEESRACLDAVAGDALVPLRIEVVAFAGDDLASDEQELIFSETYSWGCTSTPCVEPDPQPDPNLDERPLELDLSTAAAGWESVTLSFHVGDPDGRGAYLRTLQFGFDPDEEWASMHATNYSPVTQLSGFQYYMYGVLRSVELAEPPVRGRIQENIPADLDADGNPSQHRFPL